MKTKPPLDPLVEAKIEDLSRRLSDLRRKHGPRTYPSNEIWQEALSLCKLAPLSRVAKGIGVSENGLRNHTKGKYSSRKSVQVMPSRFVEVRGLPSGGLTPARPLPAIDWKMPGALGQVELQRSDGSCLRIADLRAHGIELRSLMEGFLGLGSYPLQGGLR